MKSAALKLEWIVIVLCALFYGINIWLTSGMYDANDGLAHFAIARYAPQHPELFLDHWGKPVFTLLTAPFAQFGFKAIMIFNTILFVFTALILLRLLKAFEIGNTWLAPILLAFAPVYFQVVMSGLTEVLFAFLVLAGLFLFQKEKFVWAALLITWLPFARSEAYFIVPLFALAFALKRQWVSILLLAVGPLAFSLAAWFVLDDFWWMINQNPYTGAKDIYGSGEFWHFANHVNGIFGMPTAILTVLAIGLIVYRLPKKVLETDSLVLQLAMACVVVVFLGHSYFWWKGLYGSLGLLRVLATVGPLVVFLAMYAFNQFIQHKFNLPRNILALGLAIFTIINLWSFQPIAKVPDEQEAMIQNLAKWYHNSPHKTNKNIWYMHPAIGHYLEIDNFEENDSRQLWFLNHILPSNAVREGGLIIYDGARAPNEGKTSREMLLADRHLKLIYQSTPEGDLQDMNGHLFELMVFEKHVAAANDTLAWAVFIENRPLLSGRLDRIRYEENGRPYFVMTTFTNHYELFAFWEKDKETWQAKSYNVQVLAGGEVEILHFIVYEDGTQEARPIKAGTFVMPEFEKAVLKSTILLHNPKEDQELKIYGWFVLKKDS